MISLTVSNSATKDIKVHEIGFHFITPKRMRIRMKVREEMKWRVSGFERQIKGE